jgi:uncharacterized membrane protein
VLAWRRGGWRDAARHWAVLTAAFLVPNLPFLLDAPRAWVESLLIPIQLPMFPDGLGVISLSTSGLLPYAPRPVYALAELLAVAGLAWWFARRRPVPRPELAVLLGTLPFLLAWRCCPMYVWFVPTLALCLCGRGARVAALEIAGEPRSTALAA